MKCPICKNEIKEDAKFCPKCGKKIPRCPTCNKVITKKMRFCIYDGTPLPEEVLSVFSDLEEANTIELKQPQKKGEEIAAIETTVSEPLETAPVTAPVLVPAPTAAKSRENQHYCVRCGAPCPDTQLLCPECQKKGIPNSPEKVIPKKRRRLLPLLCILLCILFIGSSAGILAYCIYNGNITPGWFSQNDTEPPKTEEEADEDKPIIDRSKTDEDETEEGSASSADDINETVENTAASSAEETIKEETSSETETESTTHEADEIDPVEYFILNCDKEYFIKDDFSGFDAAMCRLARNGIYARMGRKFQDEELNNYFLQFDWYTPTIDADDFSESLLNECQIANRDLIVEYETEQGYR